MIQRSIIGVSVFFCAVIVSLYTFAWLKGANLKSILVSGSFVLGGTMTFLGLSYLLAIRKAREYVDNGITYEPQSFRSNYRQHLLLFASVVIDILGLIMIFAKKMFLLGLLFVFIGTGLMMIWSKLSFPKKLSLKKNRN